MFLATEMVGEGIRRRLPEEQGLGQELSVELTVGEGCFGPKESHSHDA